MRYANSPFALALTLAALIVAVAAPAHAQSDEPRWSLDIGVGWDNDISGDVNSGGIGVLNGQNVVILRNTYEQVYGTGLHLRGGVGYQVPDSNTELRATLTFQSLDADYVTPMGDIGSSRLYAKYTDYQVLMLDVGPREYIDLANRWKAYGEATLGLGFIDKIDAQLVAPGVNLAGKATDLYDQTVAFSGSISAGLLYEARDRAGVFVQFGFRWTSGLAEVDDLAGTGLETINDKSSRWTMPFLAGVRFRF